MRLSDGKQQPVTPELLAPLTAKQKAVQDLSCRHRVCRAYLFSQKHFVHQFGTVCRIGLCAGLLQVWWAELRKGHDAIKCLRSAPPWLVREVLLAQARSIYLRHFPMSSGELNAVEAELLRFKYGDVTKPYLDSLQQLFGAQSALELDLVLQYGSPVVDKCEFKQFSVDVINALTANGRPGLRLLLTRFRHSSFTAERGHRSAFVIEPDGLCRFYDPSWGEISFWDSEDFAAWFLDYWTVSRWHQLISAGIAISSPPIRVFVFSGSLTGEAAEKRSLLQRRPLNHDFPAAAAESTPESDCFTSIQESIWRFSEGQPYLSYS